MTNLSNLRNALQAFDYNTFTPYAVGFDRQFDRLFDYATHQMESTGYPPYKGISQRNFSRKFTLADDIVVNGAKLENGMLTVQLERIIPEEKKPRMITVK